MKGVAHLHVRERHLEAEVQLQRRDQLGLLHEERLSITTEASLTQGLTTARLVSTESASHARVIGGIWVTQASIPTGMMRQILVSGQVAFVC